MPTARAGFFSSLFDLNFSRVVTTRVVKWLYLIVIVLVVIGLIGYIATAIISGSVVAIIIAVIVGPLVALLYIILARITFEVLVAIFRILETNREIAFLERQQLSQMQGGALQPVAPQPPPPAA
jgi:hypothetical protein